MRTALLLAAAVVAIGSHDARAQRRPAKPAMIPAALVDLVLDSTPFGKGAGFTVGATPEGWPAALVPPGTLVGGVTFGPMSAILVDAPRSANGDSAIVARLKRVGYLPVDTTRLPSVQGFVPQRGAVRHGTMFCSDSVHAAILVPMDSTQGTRQLGIVLLGGDLGRIDLCGDKPVRSFSSARPDVALRLPALRAPLGAVITPGGMSSNGNSFTVEVSADTALAASALATHYARELQRAGWTLPEPASSTRRVAIQSLAAHDSTGGEWQGALTIFTAGDRRVMHLSMGMIEKKY